VHEADAEKREGDGTYSLGHYRRQEDVVVGQLGRWRLATFRCTWQQHISSVIFACPPSVVSIAIMSFLRLESLTKRFGDAVAVDSLTLQVEQGQLVALLGPSGCGKTTTLQMIAGFVEPTAGAISLEGKDLVAVRPSQRGLGIVFQSYALFPHMTVAHNVGFGLEMRGVGRAERDQRVAEALEMVGLKGFESRYPRRMSGGQQQRVALARALVIRPSILLLDEPLSNLDAKLREEMQIELRTIQRTLGTTTLLVTHDQSEAMALADNIVVMNKGRAEQVGPPQDVYERPATPFVAEFLGKTNVLPAVLEPSTDGLVCVLADGRWLVADKASTLQPGPAQIAVRPERIRFGGDAPSRLTGTVRVRIFQGSQWLYQVDTPAGLVTVICQNDSRSLPVEGDRIALAWDSADMHVRSAGGGS
jgi:putative spermidine/putrescine transport system ATP-binding protein